MVQWGRPCEVFHKVPPKKSQHGGRDSYSNAGHDHTRECRVRKRVLAADELCVRMMAVLAAKKPTCNDSQGHVATDAFVRVASVARRRSELVVQIRFA